ncbi:anti-sigma factor domain-containing protein [Paenibacillus solisilvae]|uniref:Regulator of SigK n=1 Tax=Paenibacillus solisilvae TaxID=2486751 RepID=A0ABW0W5G7_9BACL
MGGREWLPACDCCLDYVSGICTDEEKLAFERHLPECEQCRKELEELRIVWEALPTDMDQIEPPADLKTQVMNAVFSVEGGNPAKPLNPARRPLFGKKSTAALFAAAIAAIMFMSLWNVQLYRNQADAPLPVEDALSVSAAHITQLIRLQPVSAKAERSSGVACIVDNGQSKQFVIYLFGAAVTQGDQAYQVWLVKDGKRSSAGTFRVHQTDRGIGLLAMPIASGKLAFDSIGITLEPDDQGNQPRGTKVYGSV